MKEYKSIDAVYEDIYDFDDINDHSNGPKRSGKTFTLDEYGEIVRPTHHPKVKDDRVRLPPVLIGNTRVSPSKSVLTNQREMSSTKIWNVNTVSKERDRFNGHNTTSAYPKNIIAAEHGRHFRPEPVNHDELFKSLMENNHGKSIEMSPQVLEYERRNNIRRYPDLSPVVNKKPEFVPAPPKEERGVGEVFHRRLKEYEERINTRPAQHVSTYKPAPPTAQNPENEKLSYNRGRRYLRESTTQLEQDVSVHKAPKLYNRPSSPAPDVEIDYEKEVQEAIRVQKELDQLHQEIAKMKEAEMLHRMPMYRATTAATAATPSQTTTPLPHMSAGPMKPWNGSTAKKGLGFKSNVNKEEPKEAKKFGVSLIPEKIRKEMKKYFN